MGFSMKRILIVVMLIFILSIPQVFSSEDLDAGNIRDIAPKLYLDAHTFIDTNFIKTQITFVNYVIEKNEADIHLLITSQHTGSGGREYTLQFIGKNSYAGTEFSILHFTSTDDTASEVRDGLLDKIKKGLLPFVANTPISENISITYNAPQVVEEITDPWNSWVFSISLNGNTNGQENSYEVNYNGNISATRVTQKHKFSLWYGYNYHKNYYDFDYFEYESIFESKEGFTRYVLTLGDHWGWVVEVFGNTSTYNNIDLAGRLSTGFEYNIFPYSETTVHTFKFRYKIHSVSNWYLEETIYDEVEEHLVAESLAIVYSNTQTWGSIWCMLSGIHYLHDFDLNSSNFNFSVNLRLSRGLSLNYWANVGAVHDQVFLPKGGATEEEVLLRRKAIATQYTYNTGLGITYTFGSIFSNVVNTRFD